MADDEEVKGDVKEWSNGLAAEGCDRHTKTSLNFGGDCVAK